MLEKFKGHIEDVFAEMAKVAWPKSEELQANTILVIVMAAVLTVFIGVVDIGLSRTMTALHALLRF